MITTINDSNLLAIAEAIRAKLRNDITYKPREMAAAIASISTDGALDYITADEVYEQERNPEWPLIPDPAEDEAYFLIKVSVATNNTVSIPYRAYTNNNSSPAYMEFGYMENGEFVAEKTFTPTYHSSKGDYETIQWTRKIIAVADGTKYGGYGVIRTIGLETNVFTDWVYNDSAKESVLQSFLEAKIGHSRASYVGLTDTTEDVDGAMENLEFITYYHGVVPPGLTSTSNRSHFTFGNCMSLRCIRFDKPENDFFSKGLIGCLELMFKCCYKLKTVPVITGKFYNYKHAFWRCRALKVIPGLISTYTGTVNSTLSYIFEDCNSLERISNIKLATPIDYWGDAFKNCYNLRYVINYDFGGTESSTTKIESLGSYGANLKKLVCADSALHDPFANNTLIYSKTFERQDLTNWFVSLPITENTKIINFVNSPAIQDRLKDEYWFEDVCAIATNKGYTVSM